MAGAVIAGPLRIGDNSIIGPNSVVVKDVEPDCMISGIPAEPIRIRGKSIPSLRDRVLLLEKKINEMESLLQGKAI